MLPRAFFILISLTLFSGLMACSEKKTAPSQAKRERSIPVTVTSVALKTVPVQITAIGNVEAFSTVAVKSRITGEVKQVHFKEGQDVTQGTLLFTIDSTPFEVDLQKAQATLARSLALAQKAENDLRRFADLVKKDYISQEQYDQATTNLEALKAQIKADQASAETARLQVSYCSIKAPVTGRTGILQIDKGNMIRANDERAMVIINRIQPVYCTFSVPEQDLSAIKRFSNREKLKIQALVPGREEKPEEGQLSFIDNTIDKATGTIRLRGIFPNKEKRLWPGQFVNIILTLSYQAETAVVPSQAVQTGMKGEYVFVVKPDLKAENRPVTVGRNIDGFTVIEKGLAKGELVVIDGQFRLIPGSKVQIKRAPEGKGATRS
ncbi:MAG: efflux RND transporter periplasmic adaptor subunit [Thermodesulfobacteriota bacterium]